MKDTAVLQLPKGPMLRIVGWMVYTPHISLANEGPVVDAAYKAEMGAHFLGLPPDRFGDGPPPQPWEGMIRDPLTGEHYNPEKRYLIADPGSGKILGELGLAPDFSQLEPGIQYWVVVPYDEIDGNDEEKGEAQCLTL